MSRDDGYYGYDNEQEFERAYENEVYCPRCESHPCVCARLRNECDEMHALADAMVAQFQAGS